MPAKNRFGRWCLDDTWHGGGVKVEAKLDVDYKPVVVISSPVDIDGKTGGRIVLTIFGVFNLVDILEKLKAEIMWEEPSE